MVDFNHVTNVTPLPWSSRVTDYLSASKEYWPKNSMCKMTAWITNDQTEQQNRVHMYWDLWYWKYRKISNIRRTKSQHLKWFSPRLAVVFAQYIQTTC